MSNRIFAGGLPWEADQNDLKTAFSAFGAVEDTKVIMDKDTGKSRGFGFVTFATEEEAAAAVQAGSVEMDVGGRNRTVRIQAANERPQRSSGGPPRDGRSNSGGGEAPARDDRFEDSSGGKGRGKSKGSRKGSRGGDGGGYNDGGGYHSF